MEITYDIEEELGVIGENNRGWTKEVNMISWNGGKAKFDIRDWAPEHEKMSKGITLTEDEARELYDVLAKVFAE